MHYLFSNCLKKVDEDKEAARHREEAASRSYDRVLANAKMETNKSVTMMSAQEYEENFF